MSIATDLVTDSQTVRPRRAVLDMPEYHPPLAGREALRLDFNENTLGPSPKVVEAIRSCGIGSQGLRERPVSECGRLRHGDGHQARGNRRRRVPSLGYRPKADVCLTRIEATLYLHRVSAATGFKLVP